MKPKLSIVVPTLNRTEFAKKAVDTALGQNADFVCEVILSNNGPNSTTREVFNSEPYKGKITYIETTEVFPMPEHWEWATRHATGEYLIVLPDRRLLKQGSARKLVDALEANQDCQACCCCDEWFFKSGRIVTSKTISKDTKLATTDVLRGFEEGRFDRNVLPLGLNCVLRGDFVREYRRRWGDYFGPLSPDFKSAFNFLLTANNVFILSEPLMITTGFAVSNGGKAYRGDRSYLKSLGQEAEHKFMPCCMSGNVWASIYEDYLRSMSFFGKNGDFRRVMSMHAMSSIMAEELTMLLLSKCDRDSLHRYREVKAVLKMCGWNIKQESKTLMTVFRSFQQFLPESVKSVYRYAYSSTLKTEKDVLRVAGF